MWFAMDGTMEDEEPSVQQFCVRFKEPKSASDFEEIIMKEKNNIPTDQTGPPKITEVKVKTEKVEQKKPEEKPSTLASILAQPVEIKEDKPEEPKKNLFGGLAAAMKESNTSKNTSGGFSFNFGAPKPDEKKDVATPEVSSGQAAQGGFSFSFGGGSKPSSGGFGSIAAKGNENAFSNGGFNFANKGKSIFAPTAPPKGDNENGDNEEVEGGDADPYFEPVIDLPDLVEVKTGEEGWETIFSSRAKLFRWNDKQWKERGLGECKGTVKNTINIHSIFKNSDTRDQSTKTGL